MAEFVLVAGAWLGGWAWDDVLPYLDGHVVQPLTLTGLAEKRGFAARQQTHVADIVDVVERNDWRDVVLAGHSYAGVPTGQAAERIGDRLAHLVFVDANVPADGVSFADQVPWVADAIAANDGRWPPPPAEEFAGQDLTDEQIGRIAGGTPHPGAALTEPARLRGSLGELPTTYVKCLLDGDRPSDNVAALLTGERWRLAELNTGHWPMFSQPRELAEILLRAAETP